MRVAFSDDIHEEIKEEESRVEGSELREEFPDEDWAEETSEREAVDVRASPERTTQVLRPQLPNSSRNLDT